MRSMGSSPGITGKGIAAIVGVGPGLGRSIARKFAFEGYTVAILARDLRRLSTLAEEIAIEGMGQVFAIRIDCSNSRSWSTTPASSFSRMFPPTDAPPASSTSPSAPSRSRSPSPLSVLSIAPNRCYRVWSKEGEARYSLRDAQPPSMASLALLNFAVGSLH